jgi:hypothetical protein
MGIVGYYRRFIQGFSNISHPITSLQNKGIKFQWNSKCGESFHILNKLLTSSSILKIVDPKEYFVLCTGTCKEGLCGVLTQNVYVMCYESRKLKEHERNYATHDLELAVIARALKMWRHFLMGRKFELRTNHSGLKYLFEEPTQNSIQIRWMEFLSEYDLDIKHINGKTKQSG